MATLPAKDSDVPHSAGLLGRLHLGLGRLAISTAIRLRRPVSLGVRLMALNAQGHVLLVRHSYLPGWALPGGAVEPGETCREAAVREAQEEAGLEVGDPPELFHVYLNRALGNRDHVVLFVARNARQARPLRQGLEILSAGFYAPDALPDEATPGTRARISEVLNGTKPVDIW